MKGTRRNPYQVGHQDPKTPYEPASDVEETVAWCESCGDERRFDRVTKTEEAAVEETEAAVPDVGRAITGQEGWQCVVCGTVYPNLVTDDGYEYQLTDVGYDKPQFRDEDETTRAPPAEDVTPPDRAEATRRYGKD